jgi:hypothetical protein
MKRILVGAGILLLAPIVLLLGSWGYVSHQAASSANASKMAAVGIVRDISQTWSVQGIEDRISATALEDFASPSGHESLRSHSPLGALVRVSDVTQASYKMSTSSSTSARVTFHGEFENGAGEVSVVLIQDGAALKLFKLELREARLGSGAVRRNSI